MMNAPFTFDDRRVRRGRDRTSDAIAPERDRPHMNVLSVTSELFPLIKTGGLADVTGSLPKALQSSGISTSTLVPGYACL